MISSLRIKKLRQKLPRVAMKILDRVLNAQKQDDSTLRLKIFGVSASLQTENWFHDYEGVDFTSYYLIVRRGNQIVLNIRIDEPDGRRRYVAEIDIYDPGGWEWRIMRAA